MDTYSRDKLDSLIDSVLVLNELNVSNGQQPAANDDDDVSSGESTDFMDDGDDNENTNDDDVSSGESTDFMDDGEDSSGTTESDDVSDGESTDFMDNGDTGDGTTAEGDAEGGGADDGTGADDDVSDGESTDFMDDSEDGAEGDGTSEEGESEEGEEGEGEEEGDEYDIDKIEDELFSDLTPEQIAIKNHELKSQFIEIYTIIGSTLVRINDIPKSNDNINILKFVTEKLLELREMIDYNITIAYATRTYIENNIIYQQCIATLNAIADIIDNIPNVNGGDSNVEHEKEQEEEEDLGEPVEPEEDKGQSQLDISDIQTASDYQEESYRYTSNDNDDLNDLF